MGLWLKQSTAVDVLIGPFVDSTNGNDTEEALTIEDEHVLLSKNGQALAAKNDANDATHDDLGYYNCPLNGTDTNTLGQLCLCVHMEGALPVYHEYMVVTANVYDTICSTDLFQTDVTQIGGVAQSATDLKDFADTGYNPATHKVAGVVLCDTTTTNTDMVAAAPSIADIVDAVWDEPEADHVAANSFGQCLNNVEDDTNELQADWANGGRLDTIIDSLALEATVAALNDISADNVWDEVMDASAPANCNSAREILNVIVAVLAGKASGGGTNTNTFRDTGDTKDRVSATVTADGNRTAVGTLDGT